MTSECCLGVEDEKTKKPALLKHIFAGAAAGTIETVINHPLFTLKNRIQCAHKFTLNPLILYRGVLGNAASMVPLVTIQISSNIFILDKIHDILGIGLQYEKPISAFFAGNLSSIVSTPIELTLVQQQKCNKTFARSGIDFLRNHGLKKSYTGLVGTSIRTGFVSSGFIAIMPQFKYLFQESGYNDELATLLGGFGAGLLSTFLSHPFDTIKTIQQDRADTDQVLKFKETYHKIIKEKGVRGLYTGVLARSTRVISATLILGHVSTKLLNY